jgi:hypothetical protein
MYRGLRNTYNSLNKNVKGRDHRHTWKNMHYKEMGFRLVSAGLGLGSYERDNELSCSITAGNFLTR